VDTPDVDEAEARNPGGLGSLLACSLLLGVFDVFVLGLAIMFGPGGFGGDRDWSAGEEAAANLGQAAGLVGVLLAVVALIVFAVMRTRSHARAALGAVVGLQVLATFALVLSTR
jgi:hypothetical protein